MKIFVLSAVSLLGLTVLALVIGDSLPAHRLAFVSERDGNVEIYVAHIERGLLVNATNHPALDNSPQWSPDGEWILFSSGRTQPNAYFLVNTRSWRISTVGETGNGYGAVWSPDGQKIAIRENNPQATAENTYQFRIFDMETGVIQITHDIEGWEFGGAPGVDLSETPNLIRVIVRDIHGFPRFADIRPEDFQDGGLVEANLFAPASVSISPDGQFFASAEDVDGNMDIFLVPVTEGDPINLTNDPAPDTDPIWSGDGHYVAFISYRNGNSEVYIVNVETGDITNMSLHQRRDYAPIWSP